MSLVVNHNLMAANVARNLNAHYANLSNSTQRLSTGLRVNSAADDAAGLAIRELQRADIAALHQGSRNANDAISLIQVADGALSIIDEKLIRMKELAEQAATGTYDSTQRMMIESEYQAMASEITRIANATDFNGMKLLDGTLSADSHNGSKLNSEGKMKIHFGTGNESAEDYYYIQIEESTSQAFGVGDASTWEDASKRVVRDFGTKLSLVLDELKNTGKYNGVEYSASEVDAIIENSENWVNNFTDELSKNTSFDSAEELSVLYTKYKNDEAVSSLRDLFEESIADYSTVTYREKNKMQYALGRAALNEVETFKFDNSTETTVVHNAVTTAQAALDAATGITTDSSTLLRTDGGKGTADIASTAATEAASAANTAYTELQTAKDYGVFLPGAVDAVKAVAGTIRSNLSINPPTAGSVISGSYQVNYEASGAISSIDYDNTNTTFTTGSHTIQANGTPSADFTLASMFSVADFVTPPATPTNSYILSMDGDSLTMSKDNNVFTLNSDGLIVSMVDPSSNTYTIDSKLVSGSPTSTIATMKDTKGNSITFDGDFGTADPYVEVSDITSMSDSLGNIFTFSSGKITILKDSNGNTIFGEDLTNEKQITSLIDGSGNEYRVDKATGKINSVTYAGKTYGIDLLNSNKQTVITDTESQSKFTFNINGDLIKAEDSGGNDILKETIGTNTILSDVLDDTVEGSTKYNYAGFTVATQEDAQNSLVAISDAIEAKDKIRARLGALQNRLENTISNLNIQAENLQAAESRISDVDVSTEMTEFVRQQILTQSAVAMLSQANSLPQMAMQLIGG